MTEQVTKKEIEAAMAPLRGLPAVKAPVKTTSECCGTCKFWVDSSYCQRFPTQVFKDDDGELRGRWPATGRTDWCGEWRRA